MGSNCRTACARFAATQRCPRGPCPRLMVASGWHFLLDGANPHQERVVSRPGRDHGRGSLAVLRFKVPHRRGRQHLSTRSPMKKTAAALGRTNAEGLHLQRQSACAAHAAPDAAREAAQRPARELGDSTGNIYFKDCPQRQGERLGSFSRGAPATTGCRQAGRSRLQFPKWFLHRRPRYRFMEDLREWLPDFGIAIEFRQALWMKEERRARRHQIPRRPRLHLCRGR